MMKKSIFLILAFFLSSSLLLSQSLVEAAKKEKERRAQLKKTSTIVVINADLRKKAGGEINRTVTAEDPSRKIQGTEPQARLLPKKAAPALRVENVDQVENAGRQDQMEAKGFRSNYATQILNSNELVRGPNSALDKPDGKYAEISILGILDLEMSAKNGPGADIAIYARQTGAKEMMPDGAEEGGIPELSVDFQYWEGLWYGVLGMGDQGDWVAIGKGTGTNSPEKFDLGSLTSVSKIRIMFRPHSNPDLPHKINRRQPGESTFGIDAVESLHR